MTPTPGSTQRWHSARECDFQNVSLRPFPTRDMAQASHPNGDCQLYTGIVYLSVLFVVFKRHCATRPSSTRLVHSIVRDLSRNGGQTVFPCRHNSEAQRFRNRVAVLEHGWLTVLCTPAELARSLGRGVRTFRHSEIVARD